MRSALLVTIATLAAPVSAMGQPTSVSVGDTTRIWAARPALRSAESIVRAVSQDSLSLLLPGAAAVTAVAWADVVRLDVERGRRSRWHAAVLWGLAVGFGSAWVAGSLTRHPSDREATVPLAGWAGTAVGAVFGSLRDPRRWVRISLPGP
jgi:hypothetical protein